MKRFLAPVAICATVGSAIAAPGEVVAASFTFTVDSSLDDSDAFPGDGICASPSGRCTLRAAVEESNALAGENTIEIVLAQRRFALTRRQPLTIDNTKLDLTITGLGATVSGLRKTSVFHVLNGTVSINDLRIRFGSNEGGVFVAGGALTFKRCELSNNGGGGITSFGALTVIESTISKNVSRSPGAGINALTLNLVRSTISRNQVLPGPGFPLGGGIAVDGPSTIVNSTISGNIGPCAGCGGGVVGRFVTISNSTISVNKGGGLSAVSGPMTLDNTIVAGNFLGANCVTQISSNGYNLSSDNSCAADLTAPGDMNGVDPLLGPLADNGGGTFTRALRAGSPAIDAGSPAPTGGGGNACQLTDQRGVSRPQGSRCDIGAVEIARP